MKIITHEYHGTQVIDFIFPYDNDWKELIKHEVPTSRWLRGSKLWRCNYSPWLCWHITRLFPENIWDIDERIVKDAEHAVMLNELATRQTPTRKYKDLYPFQSVAVDFVRRTEGRCILGDEMGLGKTVEALTAARLMHIHRALVVCPSVVKYKWQKEIDEWTMQSSFVVDKGKQEIVEGWNFHIMSYQMMVNRINELLQNRYQMVIFDECHYLKSRGAKRTKAAGKLIALANHYLFLSGTPFINRPMELYNMLNWLNPVEWSSQSRFGERYCGGLRNDYKGSTNRDELNQRLRQYMVRRLKVDVLEDLPLLTRTKVPIDLPRMGDYREIEKNVYAAIKELNPESKGYWVNAMDKLSVLRRAVGVQKAEASIPWIRNFLDTTDRKIVLYCHHHQVIDYLKEELRDYAPITITGRVKARERQRRIELFQSGTRERVCIINSAGGEGIDLFGRGDIDSSTILFIERQWTPAAEEQAEARLHRIGQSNPVSAYYLVARGTVDLLFDTLIDRKRDILTDIVGMDDVTLTIVPDLIGGIV